jgi:hypothetical protein
VPAGLRCCLARSATALRSRESDTAEYDLPVVMDRGLRARLGPRKRGWRFGAVGALTVLIVALVAAAGSSAGASGSVPIVTCEQSGGVEFSGTSGGNRVVLGVVSVPPAYVSQVFPTQDKLLRPWRFFSKAGLSIRAGSPAVSVSVPKTWQSRAAITWGSSTGNVSALRLAGCPTSTLGAWVGYPGGFLLRASSACVPLVFRVGHLSATVHFGIGRRCSGN